MYSVLLVDDEQLIVSSISQLIPWSECDCRIIGSETTGTMAKKLIDRLHPDIVITDIVMPEISGLELLKYCSERYPSTKVIMISAYAEFKYAQTALEAGAVAYLLKPISPEELKNAVKKAVSGIKKEKGRRNDVTSSINDHKEQPAEEYLFNFARYGTMGDVNIDRNYIKKYETITGIVIMVCFYNCKDAITVTLARGKQYWENELSKTSNTIISGSSDDKLVFLCVFESPSKASYERNILVRNLTEINSAQPVDQGISVVYVSGIYYGLQMLHPCYRVSLDEMKSGFFQNENSVIVSQECIKDTTTQHLEENIPVNPISNLSTMIYTGDENGVKQVLQHWDNILRKNGEKNTALSKIREFQREAAHCASRLNINTTGLWKRSYENGNFAAYMSDLERGVLTITEQAAAAHNLIDRAKLYIQNNYSNSGLGLELVSTTLNVNASYLSRSFKKETGENISDYITGLRIQQACDLLKNSNMKINDISTAAGFSDSHYFGQVFKKKNGMTPAEYRKHFM